MSTRWTLPDETASQIRMVLGMVTKRDDAVLRPEGRELAQRLLDELNKARCVCGRTKAHLMSAGHEPSCPHDVDIPQGEISLMGHHIASDGRFQSDKHPDLPRDRIRLNLENPLSERALRVLAEDYEETDSELAKDLVTRLDALYPRAKTMSGVERIKGERKHQIELGWTLQHDDDEHYSGELRKAAAAILMDDGPGPRFAPDWAYSLRHKYRGDAKRMLAIAGALIAAELDRLEGNR